MFFLKIERYHKRNHLVYFRVISLIAVVLIVSALALRNPHPFTSVEVAFTDGVASGLAIVPASCPASPDVGSCSCGPAPTIVCFATPPSVCSGAGGGSVSEFSCPSGYTYDGNWCVVTGSSCDTITPGSCTAGFTLDADGNCVFVACPFGYTQTTDSDGNLTCVKTVIDSCTPDLICNGADGNLYQRYVDCSFSATPSQPTCQYGCTGDTCNPTPDPSIISNLRATPSLLQSGGTTVVSWDVRNVTSCTVTGTSGDSWTGPTSGAPGETSSPINSQTIYTLHCDPLPGSTAVWADQQVTVNIVPRYQEQ